MTDQNPLINKTSNKPLPRSHYTWEYEYYEYAPVSFEGLKAHKYSIVIGFWVGLAVFVIFMFFVLTLLTKTGAPHQEHVDITRKQFQMDSFPSGLRRPLEADRIFSCQVEESRSLFHCYINEVDQQDRKKSPKGLVDSGLLIQQTVRNCKVEEGITGLAKFNIPNFVTTDQSSSLGDDDLLIYDPTIVLQNKPSCSDSITSQMDK
ncbi:melanocortin-2 receptor accessory protein 2 [Spea bombifrons]|uniref:melanocortin-2 receptor accessory protein 2 n=1 Tax=Spea bombifrons TaxID=233779 RepID=UPI0023496DDD|nr:melanocortin-2 receptor accessory protein 2 [Spea bombifrons]